MKNIKSHTSGDIKPSFIHCDAAICSHLDFEKKKWEENKIE